VADSGTHKIRTVTKEGEVTSIAGTGRRGDTSGSVEDAQFHTPHSVVIDSRRNLYVCDTGNNLIRRVQTLPNVQVASYARLRQPAALCIDKRDDTLYCLDASHAILRIPVEGDGSRFCGKGQGFADGKKDEALFNQPMGIAIDRNNVLYVADTMNNRIRRVSPEGTVTTIAGDGKRGYQDGAALTARFNQPHGIACEFDGSAVYVADTTNNLIRKIASGHVTTFAGTFGRSGFADGRALSATFNSPISLVVDVNGNVVVSDCCNNRIRKIHCGTPGT